MQNQNDYLDEQISLKSAVGRLQEIWNFLLKRWFVILVAALFGSALGLTYAFFKPVEYESRQSFVVEDSKSGVGGIAALAGQFGFDIGGASSNGVFSGDNILLFLKSESLCRETLLTNYDSSGNLSLADVYAESSGLKSKWANNKKIGEVNFSKYKDGNLPRLEDSLFQVITKKVLENDLQVTKPDKKSSFIEVVVTMKDELLSKDFGERLVKIATDRYVDSKIKLKALNVAKLQRRADSLGSLLNSSTYSAAATQQSLIDVNPGLRTAPVESEIQTRNKTMIATIFGEVVKNLEIAKVALSQETPTIQMVDQSTLPLKKKKVSKLIAIIVGGLLIGFLTTLWLLVRRWWKMQMQSGNEDVSALQTGRVTTKIETAAYSK